MASIRSKTNAKAKPVPAKNMLQVGEIRYIKERALRFLVMLSEVGEVENNDKSEWLMDASALLDEFVLKTGQELGIQCYEEIMKVMLFFLDVHNSGKKIGMGVDRELYDKWKSHQNSIEEYDKSDFKRNHKVLYVLLPYIDFVCSIFSRIRLVIANR